MADFTPDLQVSLSWGSIAESFHSLRSLSVSCFQVILGLPGPRFPWTCMSKAVLTAPLERSTCPYQRSLLSFSMRSRSSIPSCASSSMDLMVAVSCGLTLQICLIIALSFRCRWPFQEYFKQRGTKTWGKPSDLWELDFLICWPAKVGTHSNKSHAKFDCFLFFCHFVSVLVLLWGPKMCNKELALFYGHKFYYPHLHVIFWICEMLIKYVVFSLKNT